MTDKELNLTKAQNAVLSHDWGTAARLYKLLLKDDDSNIVYLKALANVYVKSDEDEKAIPYYEQIINFYPHDIEAMNSLGAIYRRIKQYQKSVEILKRAQNEQNISSVNYNLGFTFKEMGNYEDAIECFESVITENPDDVLTYNHLGSIYLLQKNYEKSVNSFKHGLQVDQNHPILNYNLARCYAESKNYRESIKYFEKALRTRPGWIEAVRDFSDVLVKCQKNSSAQELVERTIKIHPQNADLLCILGNIFLSQFDYENAAKVFEKAEEIEPNDIKILMGFSEALEKGDKIDEALEKAVEAADISPLNPDVRKRYIHTLLSAQKFDQALEHVKELEETEGDDLQVLDLYGQYYICRGNEEVANLYYKKIKEQNQEYDDYILNASDRFLQIGNLDKAEEYAKEFVVKKGKVPEGYNQLGEIYVAKGEWNKAKSVLEKSSTFRNPNVLAKKKLERVNTEINNNPSFAQMPAFDFSSLKKEDEIISLQSDSENDVFDLQKNDDSFVAGMENYSLTDSESENIKNEKIDDEIIFDDVDDIGDIAGEEIINNEENEKDYNIIEENDDEENKSVEIIESENDDEDFSNQENDNDELFDEKTFDFSQFGDLPGLNETLCEDEEDFWNEFDDENDVENENSSENLSVQMDEAKQVANQSDEESNPVQNPQYLETEKSVLNSEAFEKISQIVDKATEISNNEILQKEREIENKTAVLGALNSADTALQMAMKTQQMVKDLEEKQKSFEEEFVTKSEKMIQEAVDKKFEENMEITGDNMEFADVDEFVEEDTEFGDVDEFAVVDELCGEEAEVIEAPTETAECEIEFAGVDEFVEEETEFGDVDEFAEDESEGAEIYTPCEESTNNSTSSFDVCDFKNLRTIFEYLPENGKDSFVSNRIRMVVEYVIAKTSGKRGLLKTAKMWRKSAQLDNYETQNDEDKVTAREVYDLVAYLKTLANELEDKEISKAICESADNVLQRIQL